MSDNKWDLLFSHYTPAQLRRLGEFIISPYFNKNKHISQLVLLWIENKGKKPSDEFLFSQIYGNKPYDKAQFARLRYKSFLMLEKFIEMEHYADLPLEGHLVRLHYYADQNWEKLFSACLAQIYEIQDKKPLRDSQYHLDSLFIEEVRARFFTQNQERTLAESIQNMDQQLNLFIISKKMEMGCLMLSRSNVVNQQSEPDFLREVIQYLTQNPALLTVPAIGIYYSLYYMLKHPENSEYFEKFQTYFLGNKDFFARKEQRNLYSYIRNYCIMQINQGKKEYESHLFALYNQQLSLGWMHNEAGQISAAHFKNMVVLALRLDKTEWSADFIDRYAQELPKEQQEDVINYCRAKVLFSQKLYSQTLKHLHDTSFQDIFLELSARRLLMQTYYELGEWELLSAALNRFRVFLHRDHILSSQHVLLNRNFANALRRLAEIPSFSLSSLEKLSEELTQTSEKDWLLQKIEAKKRP